VTLPCLTCREDLGDRCGRLSDRHVRSWRAAPRGEDCPGYGPRGTPRIGHRRDPHEPHPLAVQAAEDAADWRAVACGERVP
jgi:hypothetical protein